MRIRVQLYSVLLSGLLVSCMQNDIPELVSPAPPQPVDFNWLKPGPALRIYRDLYRASPDSNLCFSPFSLYAALGLIANATEGNSREEILTALEIPEEGLEFLNNGYQAYTATILNQDPSTMIESANIVWYQEGLKIKPDFVSSVGVYYQAEVVPVDFGAPGALDVVNSWGSEKTHGKIPKILDAIPPGTIAGLANATYFNGRWTYIFDPKETKPIRFTRLKGKDVTCAVMKNVQDFNFFESNLCYGIELPYGNGDWAMYAFLPHVISSLDKLTYYLTENWPFLLHDFTPVKNLLIWFPQFEIESKMDMKGVLIGAGIREIFGMQADFTGMLDSFIQMGQVLQKTYIKVNEDGTEAAAITSGWPITGAPKGLFFTHPFVYVIAEKRSGSILFIGQVTDPEKK